jgi:hypothetical protein
MTEGQRPNPRKGQAGTEQKILDAISTMSAQFAAVNDKVEALAGRLLAVESNQTESAGEVGEFVKAMRADMPLGRYEPPQVVFEVELIDERGRQLVVSALKDKFRARWDTAVIQQRENGTRMLGEKASQLPTIPGQHIKVEWVDLTPKIYVTDPLTNDEACRTRLANALEEMPAAQPTGFRGRITGIPDREQVLSPHQMKTLILELFYFVDIGRAILRGGAIPDQADILDLPGRLLFDPLSESQIQPKYLDQRDMYYERVNELSM